MPFKSEHFRRKNYVQIFKTHFVYLFDLRIQFLPDFIVSMLITLTISLNDAWRIWLYSKADVCLP